MLLSTNRDKLDEPSMWKAKDSDARKPELNNTKAEMSVNNPRLNVIIRKWILEGLQPLGVKSRNPAFVISEKDAARIEH